MRCMSEAKTDSSAFSQAFEENPTEHGEPNQSSSECESLKRAEFQRREHLPGLQGCSEMSQDQLSAGEQSGSREQSTGTESMELCWYCVKSHSLANLNTPQLDLENKDLMPPYGGDHLSYQQDPRPHFGVARSSRSTSFPLWGTEGHREMKTKADEDDTDSISTCPRCHLGLPLDTLRWHAEKCLLFEGSRNDI